MQWQINNGLDLFWYSLDYQWMLISLPRARQVRLKLGKRLNNNILNSDCVQYFVLQDSSYNKQKWLYLVFFIDKTFHWPLTLQFFCVLIKIITSISDLILSKSLAFLYSQAAVYCELYQKPKLFLEFKSNTPKRFKTIYTAFAHGH